MNAGRSSRSSGGYPGSDSSGVITSRAPACFASRGGVEDRRRVAGEIADDLVELRHRDLHAHILTLRSRRPPSTPCAARAAHARIGPMSLRRSPEPSPSSASGIVVRDDVDLAAIPATDWDALVGGHPLLSHAFLSALHETGCAAPAAGWRPLLRLGVARRRADRRVAALCEDAFVRRVRVRLGLGRRLSPPRPPLLSEARRRDPVHAGAGTADHRARRGRAVGAARAGAGTAARRSRSRRLLVAARAVFDARGSGTLRARRDDHPPRRPIRMAEPGLSRFRRLPCRLQSRQAQESEAGATPAARIRNHLSAPCGTRDHLPRLGVLLRLLRIDLSRASFDAVSFARLLSPDRGDDAGQSAARRRRARRTAAVRRLRYLRRRDALGPVLGNAGVRAGAAFRGLLLPGDRVLHRAPDRPLRRRCARRPQARARPHAGHHMLGACHRRSRFCRRDRCVLRARTRRCRARGRRARGREPVQAGRGDA